MLRMYRRENKTAAKNTKFIFCSLTVNLESQDGVHWSQLLLFTTQRKYHMELDAFRYLRLDDLQRFDTRH
jgi:hypothetical protein